MQLEEVRKSRNQKFYEYFIILQKEFIVAELRKKIYPDINGKNKSQEIMDGKKKKIFDIAFKNSIKTIFPDMRVGGSSLYDEELRIKLYREVYGDKGLPNFIYRDDHQRMLLSDKDKRCYYYVGAEFRIGSEVGILVNVDFGKGTCCIQSSLNRIDCNIDDVSRIL